LSPESAGAAIVTMDDLGHRENFALSLRVQTRVGGTVADALPEATLHGDRSAIVEQVNRYGAAGVQHLVIEPVSNDLRDFLDQIERFTKEVMSGA
jgi:hypothetical protein